MNISDIVAYRQQHTENETQEHFGISRSALRALLKNTDWKSGIASKRDPSIEDLQKAVDAMHTHFGDKSRAARALGKPKSTFLDWLAKAEKKGLWKPEMVHQMKSSKLEFENQKLKQQLSEIQASNLTADEVREHIYKLSELDPTPPRWLLSSEYLPKNSPGAPTLLCSDIHWGEVVDPYQINGVNQYNIEIATARLWRMYHKTVESMMHQMANPRYPGITFILNGDLFSGEIHDELMKTNDAAVMDAFSTLFWVLLNILEKLADTFGQVYCVVVPGNHSRTTKKVESKNFVASNYDYLMGLQLRTFFEKAKDTRVKFNISTGVDAHFSMYDHRYLVTHGNQFRGGDGVIGPIGPIVRGDHRKRTRNGQINLEYDTMVLGHFHQIMMLDRFIVNGSVVGYNEYAHSNNFPFEPPQQALWCTLPGEGIVWQRKLVLTDTPTTSERGWISVFE